MRRFILVILFFSISVISVAQFNQEWILSAGGTSSDYSYDMYTDISGNCYITGYFYGTAVMGDSTLTSSGSCDIYAAKLDTEGNWLWVRRAGSTGADIGLGITADSSGNILITGTFQDTVAFGTTQLVTSGEDDIFVAKLDSNGNWLWATGAGGISFDSSYEIAADSGCNYYITGYFADVANFGSTSLTSSGTDDIFIAKLDSSGIWQWARRAGGSEYDSGKALGLDSGGIIYAIGKFRNTADFGSDTMTSNGYEDIFIAKLDSNGNWLGTTRTGGTGSDLGNDLVFDSSGNCYLTGYFSGTLSFGANTVTSLGNLDIFAAKMDASGNWLWASRAGGTLADYGYKIDLDSNGKVYLTGKFKSSADFGTDVLTSSGVFDAFIAGLENNGNWLWAVRAGGTASDTGMGINMDAIGNGYVLGDFYGTATFPDSTMTSLGGMDIFLLKFSVNGSSGTPLPPQNLHISVLGNDILLEWDPVTQNTAGQPIIPDSYNIYYSAEPYDTFDQVGQTESTSWTHTGAALQLSGYYKVTTVLESSF